MAVKVASIWNPKGGQGKSLLAINLAGAAIEQGLIPLVICQDPQGTSSEYGRAGNCPFEIISEIPKKVPMVDLILIDEQASDWAPPRFKFLVMPVKPIRDQIITFKRARRLAMENGREVLTVVTDIHHNRRDEMGFANQLRKEGALFLPTSVAFGKAALKYTTIFDKSIDGTYGVADRRNNLINILDAIMGAK